jgi:hypothetical protein
VKQFEAVKNTMKPVYDRDDKGLSYVSAIEGELTLKLTSEQVAELDDLLKEGWLPSEWAHEAIPDDLASIRNVRATDWTVSRPEWNVMVCEPAKFRVIGDIREY